MLVTFACLWYVTWAAQQISAVAEVDGGFMYFFIFVSLHKLSLIAATPSSSLSVTAALSSSLDRGVTG